MFATIASSCACSTAEGCEEPATITTAATGATVSGITGGLLTWTLQEICHHLAALDREHDGRLGREGIRIVQIMKQHAGGRDLHKAVVNHPFLHDQPVMMGVADGTVQRCNLAGRKYGQTVWRSQPDRYRYGNRHLPT